MRRRGISVGYGASLGKAGRYNRRRAAFQKVDAAGFPAHTRPIMRAGIMERRIALITLGRPFAFNNTTGTNLSLYPLGQLSGRRAK